MTRFIGEQNSVAFLFESGTYGSTSGAGNWIGLVQENSIDENIGVTQIRYLGNMSRNVGQMVNGTLDYTGELTYYPQNFKLLYYALGSTYETSGTTMTHNISEANGNVANGFVATPNNPWISFTLEDSKTTVTGSNFIRTLKGCNVDEFKISAAEGELVECSANYIAQELVYSSGARTAATVNTETPYLWSDCTINMPSGTKIDKISDFEFGIKNNFEANHYLNGSRVIHTPTPGNREYNFDITMHLDDAQAKKFYDEYYIGGSTFNTILDMTKSAARNCIITMSGCKVIDMEVPSTFEGPIETSIKIVPTSCSAISKDNVYKYTPW